jgi:uncharacterized Tic20 family protein
MKPVPTNEDRIWAVISHLSAIAFGMGILLPIIGWSEQRRKSNYASFQCLQALGYQSLGYTVWFLIYLLVVVVLVIIMFIALPLAAEGNMQFDTIMLGWMILFIVFVFGMFGLYLFLPVIAAVSCAFGRDFRYPILGERLEHYLGYNPTSDSEEQTWLIEEHEERWVAAMGHFSILIMLWGMLAPLTALLLQGKSSLFLKFQSIQTLVYQGGATVLYFGAGFVYGFGILLLAASMRIMENMQAGSAEVIPGFIIFIIASLIAVAILLLIPLLHVLGQYAGYRVLKGDDYRYPVLGKWVEKWIARQTSLSESKPPSHGDASRETAA